MITSRFHKLHIFFILFLLTLILFCLPAIASVTMIGNRIIYPSNTKSADVQLKNNDNFPYIIQAWFDSGDVNSTPETGKAPFIATPSFFRVQANQGQVLRITYTGNKPLPADRESVFYFNFLQVPPSGSDKSIKQNKIVISLKSRLKLFYRPVGIAAKMKNLFSFLQTESLYDAQKGYGIRINNTSPFYASLTQIELKSKQGTFKTTASMIDPFGKGEWFFRHAKVAKGEKAVAKISLVNDQGAVIEDNYEIQY